MSSSTASDDQYNHIDYTIHHVSCRIPHLLYESTDYHVDHILTGIRHNQNAFLKLVFCMYPPNICLRNNVQKQKEILY